LIVKVTSTSACAVVVIGGLQPQAMATARGTADRKATGFRCGVSGVIRPDQLMEHWPVPKPSPASANI
jgi:hypothetical protein